MFMRRVNAQIDVCESPAQWETVGKSTFRYWDTSLHQESFNEFFLLKKTSVVELHN